MLPKPNYNPLKIKLIDKYKYVQTLMQKTEEDSETNQGTTKAEVSDPRKQIKKKQINLLQVSPSPAQLPKMHSNSHHISVLEDGSLNTSQQSIPNIENQYHLGNVVL